MHTRVTVAPVEPARHRPHDLAFCRALAAAGRLRRSPRLVAALNLALPPNQLSFAPGGEAGKGLRAKCSVITLAAFLRECSPRRKDHFCVGRLFQPAEILFSEDQSVRERVVSALAFACAETFHWVRPWLPPTFDVEIYCRTLLQVSYAGEIRPESAQHVDVLLEFLHQLYAKEMIVPGEVLLPMDVPDREVFESWLTEKRGAKVEVSVPQRGRKRELVQMAPAGDALPVLAAAEAVVRLQSAAGMRHVAFANFYSGYRKTVMRPDELIVAIEIPSVPGRQWFRKVGTRAAQAISKVVMAAVRSARPRIALGSVAPTVVRAWETEHELATTGRLTEARRILMTEIAPIDDLRSTAEYRRRVAGNLL